MGSGPDLALADEDVSVVDPQEDVGLSLAVEALAGGLSLEGAPEGGGQDVTESSSPLPRCREGRRSIWLRAPRRTFTASA